MKINYISLKKGFTLIELMVVIAIIAVLTAIVTSNFAQSKAKARDAKRISDLAQIQLTLELAFDRCNVYPPNIDDITTEINGSSCKDSTNNNYTLGYFISKVPKDINGNSYFYHPSATFVDYALRAVLESNSSTLLDSAPSNLDVNCTSPATGQNYCVVPK